MGGEPADPLTSRFPVSKKGSTAQVRLCYLKICGYGNYIPHLPLLLLRQLRYNEGVTSSLLFYGTERGFNKNAIQEGRMAFPLYQVDAFTDRPFGGNPAAVCLLDAPADPEWMQKVAGEMNLAETAFLVPENEGYGLRWFTPVAEVALCGHATLASAHVLWETGRLRKEETARFWTKSGLLTATQRGDQIELDFPAKLQTPTEAPPELLTALGVQPNYVGRNEFDYLLALDSEASVRGLRPDYGLLRALPVRGVIVTARSESPEFDFVSRFFAPGVGIDEDPATGSAHCCLGPFWQDRLGKEMFTAYQASPRGAILNVAVRGDRVLLGGQAITILRGELCC